MGSSSSGSRWRGPFVVVEAGSDWVKIAQVEKAQGGVAFSRLHLLKAGGAEADLSAAIRRVFSQWKVSRASVVACLPRQAVNIRMLELPTTDPDEIADMVDLQCGKQTPYSQDEIVANHSIVGMGRQGYTRVLLAIVQRPILRQRFALFEAGGIEVSRMTVSTEAILNWQKQAGVGGPGAFVLLDIDSSYTDFMVFSEKGLVFTRSLLIGGAQLLAEFDACKAKFAREVKQSLDTCLGELPGLSVGKLLITGAGQNLPALVTHLGPQLGLQPECFDSLQSMKRLPPTPSLRDPAFQSLSLTALAGLALGPEALQMNLIPDSVRTKRELIRRARVMTALAMTLMMLMVSGSLLGLTHLFIKAARLKQLQRETAAALPAVEEVTRMRELVRLVGERQDTRLAPRSLLQALREATPEKVYVDAVDLNAEQGQMMVGGAGDSIKDVRAFVQNLEQQSVFKDVAEGQTRKDDNGRFKFQIACSLEKSI